MAEKMLKFIDIPQRMPEKRDTDERRHDFNEIYREFDDQEARTQASRCSQCGIPFCQVHCPVQNNIPDWLRLTAEGRLEEAYAVSQATNNFPEICGRICPQDRLCEGNCVIEKDFHSVTIGSVEKYITDTAWEKGWVKPVTPTREREESIGIIGGGPAGLAAAEELRRRGYRVTVYDRHDRMGGLLIYGIPGFKLEKSVVMRRTRLLEEAGIELKSNFAVGRDAGLDELRQRHDAILIATGVYKARDLELPGSGLSGVHQALDYLIAANRKGLGDKVPDFDSGLLDARGKHVVVIGGGDTAMDCVRTAIRQEAASVTCMYRRDRANMPGSMREVRNAEEEGVHFEWLSAPRALLGDDAVTGVRAIRMRLSRPDSSGRQTPKPIPETDFTLKADMVIKALGFDPEDVPRLFGCPELEVTRWGTVKIDHRSMMTPLEGVFAAGDIVRGASLVVWGIRDGRDAAENIHHYLLNRRTLQAASA